MRAPVVHHAGAREDLRENAEAMESEERERHRLRLAELPDAELRAMVVLARADYLPEVVELACEEIKRRGLAIPTPESYWRDFPDEWLASAGFCYGCWEQTTEESPGNGFTVNLIGTAVTGEEQPCAVCSSTVKTKHFWIVVPLIPLGRYRVIRYGATHYIGRRLKNDKPGRAESG